MSDEEKGGDLLSMLAGIESAIAEIGSLGTTPETAVDDDDDPEMRIPDESAVFSTVLLREDPFAAERAQHLDPPVRYEGVPAVRGATAAVFARFAWGDR